MPQQIKRKFNKRLDRDMQGELVHESSNAVREQGKRLTRMLERWGDTVGLEASHTLDFAAASSTLGEVTPPAFELAVSSR